MRLINPSDLPRPRGFSHGVVTPPGSRVLYIAGQTAAREDGTIDDPEFVTQFDASLGKVVRVVRAAGGDAAHIARLTIYVTDLDAYRASRPALREVWRRWMNDHYPAIALVQVAGLVDRGATVEIQADAVLP